MKNENAQQSLQSTCKCENMLQEGYGLDIDRVQPIRKGIYEGHNREDEDRQELSMPPSPQKKARVERSARKNDLCKRKGEKRSRHGFSHLALDASNDVTYIKSEFPDNVKKGHAKEKIASCQIDASVEQRNSSLHSTAAYDLQGITVSSVESPHAVESGASANKGLRDTRHFAVKTEPTPTSPDALHDQPDSSTGSHEQVRRDFQGHRHRLSSNLVTDVASSACLSSTCYTKGETTLCQVCGDLAAGFYCRAYICEACKKFFIRASKGQAKYVCLRSKHCAITKESRVHCQYCRYQKCVQLNMSYSNDGQSNVSKIGVQEIPCRVCSAPSSGFHFGALTCEGCKGFFRRMVKEREAYSYKCSRNGGCEVNALTRNMCKACRYNKCLQIGMSVEGSRIGRQPNAIKHALSLEARKQATLKVEPGTDHEGNTNSSPSHISFDSVILDHFIPGDMDDSLHSIDLIQVSSSADVHKPSLRKADEIKPEPEPSFPYCQVNHVLNEPDQQVSFATLVDHSNIVRHHLTSSSPSEDRQKLIHNSYTSSLTPLSISTTIHRNFEPQIFGRPHIELFDSANDNQPQNLSIDLSKPRTLTTDSDHTPSQNLSPASSHLSSSSENPPTSHINLQAPSPDSSSPSYNYPIDYTHQVQQNVQCPYPIHSFVNQDKYFRPSYQQLDRYEVSSEAFNMDSHNSHHTGNYSSRHMPQRETYVNRMFSQSAQNLGVQFSSQFADHDRLPYIIHEQHHRSYFHHHGLDPLHHPEPTPSRQNNMDEMHPQSTGHQEYTPQLERGDVHRSSSDLHNFHELERGDVHRSSSDLHNFHNRSCQSPEPDHLLVPQRMSHSHTSTLSEPSCYVLPHSSPYSTASSAPQYFSKEPRLIPRSPQNSPNHQPMIHELSSSTPVPGKVPPAVSNHHLDMSNEELHGVLLDAARNLANFCSVSRAKSDVFEAGRFQDVDSTWEKMMEHFNFHARYIVRFAKKVPGFRSLKIDDQVLLLRMATYSLVILNHSRVYEPDTGFYNYFNFSKREIQMIREFFPEFDVIHIHYKHIGIMAQRDGLTEMEYAYLSCMLLLNDGYTGLENTERTKELKERFLDAFQDYEIEHFPNGNLRFGEILRHLSEFSQFNMQHNVAVGLVITKNPQLHIPQLYAEMYTHKNFAQSNSDSLNDDEAADGSL